MIKKLKLKKAPNIKLQSTSKDIVELKKLKNKKGKRSKKQRKKKNLMKICS